VRHPLGIFGGSYTVLNGAAMYSAPVTKGLSWGLVCYIFLGKRDSHSLNIRSTIPLILSWPSQGGHNCQPRYGLLHPEVLEILEAFTWLRRFFSLFRLFIQRSFLIHCPSFRYRNLFPLDLAIVLNPFPLLVECASWCVIRTVGVTR